MKEYRSLYLLLPLILSIAFTSLSNASVNEPAEMPLDKLESILAKTPEEGGYLLYDSRSESKYVSGHLPWANSLPYETMEDELEKLPPDYSKPLIFYCDGKSCDLSGKAAKLAMEEGYTDVSVFTGGYPAWKEAGHSPWVEAIYIEGLIDDPRLVGIVVDSRSPVKYMAGTIPGAVNIPLNFMEELKGTLPADKNVDLIFFCGGYKCDLSHKSAAAARALGYANTFIYAEGWPGWKERSSRAFIMMNPKITVDALVHEIAPKFKGEIRKGEFQRILDKRPQDVLIVDVRPSEEYAAGHIEGAVNISDVEFEDNVDMLKSYSSVILYCNAGNLASVAYFELEYLGIEGGYYNGIVNFNADGSITLE
ncbi:MAG: hypothetical protein C0609_01070 [Deltaproteobacteria bacterium]|nr:MAG: hypothetical protein C0609_01070 [Deltaproteobacteria bacterium]